MDFFYGKKFLYIYHVYVFVGVRVITYSFRNGSVLVWMIWLEWYVNLRICIHEKTIYIEINCIVCWASSLSVFLGLGERCSFTWVHLPAGFADALQLSEHYKIAKLSSQKWYPKSYYYQLVFSKITWTFSFGIVIGFFLTRINFVFSSAFLNHIILILVRFGRLFG